ncbi:MAG: transglycosylase domain-containing protein [Actinomycetota bacterium]
MRNSFARVGAQAPILAFLRRRWWLIGAVVVALGVIGLLALFVGQVPVPNAVPGPQSTKLLAADGQLVGVLHGEQNRTLVPLSAISPNLAKAVVAAEDRAFYHHSGVSIRGILRAIFTNVRSGGIRQGGSTITQQYVRNAFVQVGRERTIFRKFKEVALSIKIERRYSKRKILEFYLNTVYFGRGAYGAEAASRTYFAKAAEDLTVSEAAFLAGAIRAPERFQSAPAAIKIRNEVLGDMLRAHSIASDAAEAARREPMAFSESATRATSRAAFFVEYVRRLLKDEFNLSDDTILRGGLEVHTTIDLKMQDSAERAVAETLDKPDDPEAALVAIDVQGNVKAMVGGRQFTSLERARGFNFAWQRSGKTGGRQPGSAFKPLTLAAFVQEGYSIESRFTGTPMLTIESPQCRNPDGSPWTVHNFDNDGFGAISVTDATVSSVNTVYAQMVDLITPQKVAGLAQKVGGWSGDLVQPVCSIALGTPAVTPLEMARAFAAFASGGERPEVMAVTKIIAPGGRVVAERQSRRETVLDRNVADTVNQVLQGVLTRGTAKGKGIGRPAAGKTGTTQNHVDAWFLGYTPTLVASVWMGFPPGPDGAVPEMNKVHGRRVTGGSFPATIWQKFMTAALAGTKPVSFPAPTISGKVLAPEPEPCPPDAPPPTDNECIAPSPTAPALPFPFPVTTPTAGQPGFPLFPIQPQKPSKSP